MKNISIYVDDIEISTPFDNNHVSVWGTTYVEMNGCAFPDSCWYDCLDMLVPYWFDEIKLFIEQNREDCELAYFDGPYKLLLRRVGGNVVEISCVKDEIHSRRVYQACLINLSSFLREFTEFGKRLLSYCENYDSKFRLPSQVKLLYSKLDSIIQDIPNYYKIDDC